MKDDVYPSGLGAHPALIEKHAAIYRERASHYYRNGKYLSDMTKEELIEEIGLLLTGVRVMSDRYSEEIAERDRFIAWVERDNGSFDDSGEMSEERYWRFTDPYRQRDWIIWATAAGIR